VSYTLNNIAVPALLALPSAASAATAFAELNTRAVQTVRALAGVSAASFLAAYAFSPRSVRHPYLLWTTLIVAASGSFDLLLPSSKAGPSVAALKERARKEKRGKARLEASYEVLGDSTSEAGISDEGSDEDVNGEEVRSEMVAFKSAQAIRFYLSGAGFVMSLVGLWGDGAW
jgi:autophagy-related protein 33